jgi:hypothetical protein
MIVTLSLAYLLVGYLGKTARRVEKETKRALVSSYLQDFDTQDVNVQHSSTGGWHGTYVGKLVEEESTRHGIQPSSQAYSNDERRK